MELKDVILSTLQEIDDNISDKNNKTEDIEETDEIMQTENSRYESEQRFLQTIQERLLVLFEGFQSPNNAKIDAKVDLTLNFLEYLLAMIENRLQQLSNKDSL